MKIAVIGKYACNEGLFVSEKVEKDGNSLYNKQMNDEKATESEEKSMKMGENRTEAIQKKRKMKTDKCRIYKQIVG